MPGEWSTGNHSAGKGCCVHARKLNDEVGSSVYDKEQVVNNNSNYIKIISICNV